MSIPGCATHARGVRGHIFTAVVVAILCAFPAIPARAQSDAEKAVRALSVTAQTTVKELSSLVSLPADDWRFHAGDVAHGESTDLDDSAWQTVIKDTRAPTEAVWYRRSIEVPKTLNGYDLTGSRVWLQFVAYANGPMPEIIYFNGRRVAMGEDLEPIVLFDQAKPGDKVLVAIKLLHTVDQKYFAGANLRVEFAPSRPNPSQLLEEIQSVAELIPTLGAASHSTQQQLETAASAVDLNALHQADQKTFDTSLEKAQALLMLLKPSLQGTSVRLTGNSHIDAAWLWPWTETVDVVRRTFSTALQLMDEYPQYTFTQSAAAYSEWIVQKYPSVYQEILRPREARPLGIGRRHVGRAGPEYAGRRIAGAPVARGQALLQGEIRRGCAHRLESGFFRLQLAAAANLQKVRDRLFRHAKNGLERHQQIAHEAFLVAIAGRQPRAHLFSARLCERNRSCANRG